MWQVEVIRRDETHESVTEVSFSVVRDGHQVPAYGWLPTGRRQAPVVLLGHGGSGHKSIDRHHRFARRLVAGTGVACLAIDGPFHGGRAVPGDGPLDNQQRVVAEGPVAVHARMTQDWLTVLSAASEAWELDGDLVGYLGLSMGSRYGLDVCAALGSRLQAAVIGTFGLATDDAMMGAMAVDELLRESAAGIFAPVLHHVQWDDEVFPRYGQFQLFDEFASPTKIMRARPGAHRETRSDDEAAWCEHLSVHLVGVA